MDSHDGGFTLVELLVVIVVLGVLVAIAIPVFLAQRDIGYRSSLRSDLRNAAIGVETAAVRHADAGGPDFPGHYGWIAPGVPVQDLPGVAFRPSVGTIRVIASVDAAGQDFCLEATDRRLGAAEPWHYRKSGGAPERGACA